MKYRDLARRLRELGCEELAGGRGSHRKWHNPVTDRVTVVPDWGASDLAPGTVRAVIRELGITRQEFGPIR
ncbi:MAG: type II toxin-antitoxin system HicA family toxin [Chloroflexi bacterium]|nr:type II toxin-antitoxin system HicA family toxin [Chloroflexota bacterium]